MRIISVSCVKNEADIIESFARHAAAKLDHLIIMDRGSADETTEILDALIKEGLPITRLDDPTPGHDQSIRLTTLIREHAIDRFGADWIIPLDADEYLINADPREVLATEGKSDQPYAMYRKTYVPDPSDSPGELNPAKRMRYRLVREKSMNPRVIVPAALGRLPGYFLEQGGHGFGYGSVRIPPVEGRSLRFAHLPGRSPAQLSRKVAVKHLQYLATADRHPAWGSHNHTPLGLLLADRERFEADFRNRVINYSTTPGCGDEQAVEFDPIEYLGGDLRYTQPEGDDRLLRIVIQCAEAIARDRAKLASGGNVVDSVLKAGDFEHRRAVAFLNDQLRNRDDSIQQLNARALAAESQLAEMQRRLDEAATQARLNETETLRKLNDMDIQRRLNEAEMQRRLNEAETQTRRNDAESLRKLNEIEQSNAAIQMSWTWKVGRAVLGPPRWLRNRIRAGQAGHDSRRVA